MADEIEIRIEPGEPEPGGGGDGDRHGDWAGSGATSRRLVRGRSPWRQGLAVLAAAGLVAAGLVTALRQDGGDGADDGSGGPDRRGHEEQAGVTLPRVAWAEAALALSEAGSFAYHGTIHASAAGPIRPGAWLGEDVSVRGAVVLPESITRETAVAPGGEAAETVTSGAAVWTRTARGVDRLAGARWDAASVPAPETLGWESSLPARSGLTLLVDLLGSAGNRHSDPPDDRGHLTLHATVPDRSPDRIDLAGGAELSLTLDEDRRRIERFAMSYGPADDPELTIDLAIDHVGEPDLVTPADVDEPARRTVRMDVLDPTDLEPVEPGRLPDGWALTGALAASGGDTQGLDHCPQLRLDYRDLALDDDGWLALSIASDECRARNGGRGDQPERFRAGPFSGSALEGNRLTSGAVSDGVTAVGFVTNLSLADVRPLLASLVPFDARSSPDS